VRAIRFRLTISLKGYRFAIPLFRAKFFSLSEINSIVCYVPNFVEEVQGVKEVVVLYVEVILLTVLSRIWLELKPLMRPN
jgi:hypothetical protein